MTSQTQRSLLFTFIGSISLCGMLGIYCVLIGDMTPLTGRVLASTSVIGAASILGMAAAVPWECRRWHPVGPLGCIAAGVAAVLLLFVIWVDSSFYYDWVTEAVLIACTLGVAIPHVGLLSMARLRKDYGWVRSGTVVTICLLAGLIILTVLFKYLESDLMGRCMGALAIADVCGTLAVPILHRVSRIRETEAVRSTALQLTLTCPRCSTNQELPAGRAQCSACGLQFRIEIDEEHCDSCGYVLYGNESGVCPECGQVLGSPPK